MKDILITSSVLIVALLALRQVFKKTLSRRVQYALWGLVLARLLLPVSLPAVNFSVLTAAQPVQNVVSERLEQVVIPSRPVTGMDMGTVTPAQWPLDHVEPQEDPLPQWDKTTIPGTYYPSVADHPKSGMTAGELLALVWKVGMAVMGGFFLLSNFAFYLKLKKHRKEWRTDEDIGPYGVNHKVYLVPEGVLPSPCLFWNAIYLTPAALRSEESLRHVLTHEETHAKHWDPLWSLLRCVCLAVYWFDPLVWVAAACAKTDCELACDEAVLERLGEHERVGYGQTLLSLIPVKRGANPLLTATTMTAGKRQLKDRITRIAQKPRQLAMAVAAVALLALAISACTFTGGTAETTPNPDPSPTVTESLELFPIPTPAESQEPSSSSSDTIFAPGVSHPFSAEGTGILFGMEISLPSSDETPEADNETRERYYFLALTDDSVPTRIHIFDLAEIPGDNTYQVLANSFSETVFEWEAGTTVDLLTLYAPESANLRIRLETEDGAAAVEYTLEPAESSIPELWMLYSPEKTIPAAGRYRVKVAAGEELSQGTLILRVMSPVPELEWPADFPAEMYRSIQIIENEFCYAYLGTVSRLPGGGTDYYISVVYKDGRAQWQYMDKDKHSSRGDPQYRRIVFGDDPHLLVAYDISGEKLVELDLDAQEILRQYEINEIALQIRSDLDLIMDHDSGNLILQLNTPEDGMGEDHLVSLGGGYDYASYIREHFTDPDTFLWSRADFGPQGTDDKDFLILCDPARNQFLCFTEGSDIVGSVRRDRPVVYYRAQPADPDDPLSQDIFSFMRSWYYYEDPWRAEQIAAQRAGITMEQVDALIDKGYIPEEIEEMTPEQVDEILTRDLNEEEKAAYYRTNAGTDVSPAA